MSLDPTISNERVSNNPANSASHIDQLADETRVKAKAIIGSMSCGQVYDLLLKFNSSGGEEVEQSLVHTFNDAGLIAIMDRNTYDFKKGQADQIQKVTEDLARLEEQRTSLFLDLNAQVNRVNGLGFQMWYGFLSLFNNTTLQDERLKITALRGSIET